MKTTSNKDMLNAIRNQASEEYKERMELVTTAEGITDAQRKLNEYPSIKNEFINTLINKVVRTDFFSKVYENPLKMLKKGTLPYGHSIEELFVKHAEAKGFYNDGEGLDSANALVGTKKATIDKLYISRNFAYVFKVSISDAQLKGAFMSANGLSELVNQLVGSLTSGAEFKEYEDMIALVDAAAKGERLVEQSNGTYLATAIPDASQGVKKPMKSITIENTGKDLAKKIRTYAARMKFMSDEYNMAQVKTFCSPEDLVLLVEPETLAELDVEVLAQAFNVSAAEVGVRTIVVDKLPQDVKTGTVGSLSSGNAAKAILMDKNFIQAIDTVNEARQFENGRNLTTNVFLHKQGIMANCYFANCIAFVK